MGAQALMVADRKIELDYVFDRLGDHQLIQAYRLLVPERRKLIERGQVMKTAAIHARVSSDKQKNDQTIGQPDGSAEGVRSLLRIHGSI